MIFSLLIVLAVDLLAWHNTVKIGHSIVGAWVFAPITLTLLWALLQEDHAAHQREALDQEFARQLNNLEGAADLSPEDR